MKRFVSTLIGFSMLASMCYVYASDEQIPVLETDRTYEAEEAFYNTENITLTQDSNASGGYTLKTPGTRKYPEYPYQTTVENVNGPMIVFNIRSEEEINGVKLKLRLTHDSTNYATIWQDIPNDNVDGWTSYAPKIKTAGVYEWVEIAGIKLVKGDNIFKLAQSKYHIRIDQLKVDTGLSEEYKASSLSGNLTYPEIMEIDRISNVPPFGAGDNVIFIGDSITHGAVSGSWHGQLYSFYATRYPDVKFSYINKAIGGNTLTNVKKRMNYDIFNGIDAKPNKAVILIGTNDMELGNYYEGQEQLHGDIWRREYALVKYENNLRDVIDTLKEKGIEEIILISPPLYDEWSTGISNSKIAIGFNNVARLAGAVQYKLSKEYEDVYFVDINTPMYLVDKYNKDLKGPEFNLFGSSTDRVHPAKAANWIIAYSVLKAQGRSGEVATVDINATYKTVDRMNAEVENLNVEENKITYTYKPYALPLGADSAYREAESYFPITEELNREIIKVSGLEEGVYDIKIDGALVMSASKTQLEKGVNIADKENNPGQRKALKVLGLSMSRIAAESDYRQFQYDTQSLVTSYSLDVSSNENLIASAENYLSTTTNASAKTKLTSFLEKKEVEAQTLSDIKSYETSVYNAAALGSHNVVIEKSSSMEAPADTNIKYVKAEIPENLFIIKKKSIPEGVFVERIEFIGDNGEEIKSVPRGGTVSVIAKVTNNTMNNFSSKMWSASYTDGFLENMTMPVVDVEPLNTEYVRLNLETKEADNLIKAGLWQDDSSLNPYTSLAVYPSQKEGVSAIYVGRDKLELKKDVYEYTYMLPYRETNAPLVYAISSNSNKTLEIKQAENSTDVATVKAGDKVYTIRFKVESTPHVTEIRTNGKVVEDFFKDGYYYEVPKADMGTVTASSPDDVEVIITQPTIENPVATIETKSDYSGSSRTYTIRFIDRNVGEIQDVKYKGASTTSVKGVPSIGVKPVNYYDRNLSPEQMLANLKRDGYCEDNAYAVSNAGYRTLADMWDAARSEIYGYNIVFAWADTGGSMLMNKNVTRLYKPDADYSSATGIDTTAIYEFTLSKPGTVYISTNGISSYIESLDAGWEYEFDEVKYTAFTPSYYETQMSDGTKFYVPTGGTRVGETTKGHVYKQHFNANEQVKIPGFAANASNRKMSVFVIWDEK